MSSYVHMPFCLHRCCVLTHCCRYNFMPLARGSALCGYVTILGALLAAGAPVRSAIPQVGAAALAHTLHCSAFPCVCWVPVRTQQWCWGC